MTQQRPLEGMGIVVTRPAHQAGHLASLIAAAGGEPILFPVLEILECDDQEPVDALIARLEEFDLAIFISPNAVAAGMKRIRARRALPPSLAVAAVGQGSAAELRRLGIEHVLVPTGRFDSEGLLACPELADMRGKRVVIFRGDGGRELLADTLAARGAHVEYCECYRRGKPTADPAPLLARWARGEIHAVTVSSGEGMRNLWDMVGEAGRRPLRETPLFAPHEKIAAAARTLGMEHVHATSAGDEGLIDGMVQWRRHRTT